MPTHQTSDFLSFLWKCKTHDPASPEPKSVPDWPYIISFAELLTKERHLLVVKSRQLMVTWIGCAWVLHRALNAGPGQHIVISKEERSAMEMVERIRFLLGYLDEAILGGKPKVTGQKIDFPWLEAQIVSLPAAPHAVRGRSPRTLFWDEMAFTPNDEEIWSAVKPAVDSGGAFLGVSTPNGPGGVFARLVNSDPPAFPVQRIHYSENPNKDESWLQQARSGLSEARWRREQELSFEGAEGRVYDQFDPELHVVKRSHRPGSLPGSRLYRGVDFGYRHPAAVWVEEDAKGNLLVFDCIEGLNAPIQEFAKEMKRVDAKHHLSARSFTHTAVDPAGASMNDFGIRPVETLQIAGFRPLHRHSTIAPGIEAVRSLLRDAEGKIRLRVHQRCTALIDAFHGYAWSDDGESPAKDGVYDHLMDALRYLIVNLPRFQRLPLTTPARIAGLDKNGSADRDTSFKR